MEKTYDDLSIIYEKNQYSVADMGDSGYLIINTNKEFDEGHSHVEHYNTCIYLINLCISKKTANHLPIYLLRSLSRISDDDNYINKIDDLIINKIDKKKNNNGYINPRKNIMHKSYNRCAYR